MNIIITYEEAKQLGLTRYFTGIPCKNDHISERLVSDRSCCDCKKLIRNRMKQKNPKYFGDYANKWRENNIDRARESQRILYQKHRPKKLIAASQWRENNPKSYMLTRAKSGARKRNIEFTITIDDIVLLTHCPILELELVYSKKGNGITDNLATLDRVDSSKGYVPGNVCVISWRANWLKSNATLTELKSMVKYIESFESN